MLPDRVSNPGPLTYKSGALPIALRGPTNEQIHHFILTISVRIQAVTPLNGITFGKVTLPFSFKGC